MKRIPIVSRRDGKDSQLGTTMDESIPPVMHERVEKGFPCGKEWIRRILLSSKGREDKESL